MGTDLTKHGQPDERLRLAGLLAALSLESDMAMGHPPEEAMRTCLIATALARRLGFPKREVADVYWTALLMHVGCTAPAHEQASLFGGDDVAVNAIGSQKDFGNPTEVLAFMRELGRGMGAIERARLYLVGFTRGWKAGKDAAVAVCEIAATTADRIGLSRDVQRGLDQLFERWDGKGDPEGLQGEAIAPPARLAQLAAQASVFDRLGGVEAAIEIVRGRSGTALDPLAADEFVRCGEEILKNARAGDPWEKVLAAEPAPQRWIADEDIDEVARAFADIVDLKTTFTLGHSPTVARLAGGAARALGFEESEIVLLRRAGYLHDLGRVGVPSGILEKAGPLTTAEWEQVRLHPYHSERILSRSPALASLAPIVGMHHERLDGSGYHRQATGGSIPMPARVLAAADTYDGLTQERPYRAALSPSEAADRLSAEVRAGRMDGEAVEAILSIAGLRFDPPARQEWPADLTDREVDVLRLIARGLSNREVGQRLFISPKTVGRHTENIYQKLGVSSRAAAAVFAVHHDLLRGVTSITN